MLLLSAGADDDDDDTITYLYATTLNDAVIFTQLVLMIYDSTTAFILNNYYAIIKSLVIFAQLAWLG